MQPFGIGEEEGIELISMDKGPGLGELQRCMADGYSTAGSPGLGLGSLMRLSTEFDVYSQAGQGAIFLCRVAKNPRPGYPVRNPFSVGALTLPLHESEPCGDSVGFALRSTSISVVVADGLGHGLEAAHASNLGKGVFRKYSSESPASLMQLIHKGLQSTRGAAVSVAEIDCSRGIIKYCGIGNVAGRVFGDSSVRHLLSHNGIVGGQAKKIEEYSYPWPDGGILVMYSDGISLQWSLDKYPGLVMRHPSVIAATIFRDFYRGTDDASILVVKGRSQS
jgi:hypothetical protein